MSQPDHPAGPSPSLECARAHARRQHLAVTRPAGQEAAQWGLSLSGGGIRSATFSLGVLQGLARRAAHGAATTPLIKQFDFVSTVSGGGYIGSFFNSLFVKGRLSGQPDETDAQAANRAYLALLEDPPGRIHTDTVYDSARPGRAALAWLRDNGRYMAPTGTGDMLYDAAIAVRNWFATQYVVGTVILMVLSLLLLLRMIMTAQCPAWRDLEMQWRAQACQACAQPSLIWWSPSWWLSLSVVGLFTVPLGMAYWFSHPAKGATLADRPRMATMASVLALGAGLSLMLAAVAVPPSNTHGHVTKGLLGMGAMVGLSVLWYGLSAFWARSVNISAQRVLLTRWLARSFMAMGGLAALALVETLAQTGLLWLALHEGVWTASIGIGLVWLVRQVAQRLADKSASSWAGKLPAGIISGVVGAGLWLTVAACWDALLTLAVWPQLHRFDPAWLDDAAARHDMVCMAALALLVSVGLSLLVGRFPGFLNLSTLQSLYSARLTRAYLGATNHRRFDAGAPARNRDVAEPIDGDGLDCAKAYASTCAPVHFINVCVNQTVSPGEQLVQQDRQGKPLVVAPGGVYFDRQAMPWQADPKRSELTYPLAYGEWVGVSGAAFSTGLGRGTGLGLSLALGFANVRLGRWWAGLSTPTDQADSWWRQLLTPQAYLLDELRGRFYANHRQYQYLSDGGHFENTAAYELINPLRDRGVRLIVMCDCGCDPDYEFNDLANLTRLARIDHGLDIQVNAASLTDPATRDRFGRPEDFRRQANGQLPAPGQRCAVLLDVHTTATTPGDHAPGTLMARIILIKPTLLSVLPNDVSQYQSDHTRFPQEPTTDQFFDEAQWESYRQLGLTLAQHLFPADPASSQGQAFWQVCLGGLSSGVSGA